VGVFISSLSKLWRNKAWKISLYRFRMDYALIAYIVFCIFLIAGGGAVLFRNERPIAGALFVAGSLGICIYYGMRWFKGNALAISMVASSDSWPPVVNACPDFMTKRVTSAGAIVCEDVKNYYSLAPASGLPTGVSVSAPTSSENGKLQYTPGSLSSTTLMSILTNNPNLRWEGIYDGVSQTNTSL
jgi:hypothetical protein